MDKDPTNGSKCMVSKCWKEQFLISRSEFPQAEKFNSYVSESRKINSKIEIVQISNDEVTT